MPGAVSYALQASPQSSFDTTVTDLGGIKATLYSLSGLQGGLTYYWRARAEVEAGSGDWSQIWSFATATGTSIAESSGHEFRLLQNSPNPVGSSTTISFSVSDNEFTVLRIVDLLGKEVEILLSQVLHAGPHRVTWNAAPHSSGVYLYQLIQGGNVQTRKLLVVK